MAQAKEDENNKASRVNDTNVANSTALKSEETEHLNTDEILDIAHNMNTENIENMSIQLSDSLKILD